MKTIIVMSTMIILALASCKKDVSDKKRREVDIKGAPKCLEKMVKKSWVENDFDITNIWKYNIDGKQYFIVNKRGNDRFSELFDQNCNYICAPYGGISGQGDGQCPSWIGSLKEGVKIWDSED